MRVSAAVILLLLMISHMGYAAGSVSFTNFSKPYVLIERDTGYQVENSALSVQLSTRIIVKTSVSTDKAKFSEIHSGIERITELYQGYNFQYLMLGMKDKSSMLEALALLQKDPEVLLTQPDILQHRPIRTNQKSFFHWSEFSSAASTPVANTVIPSSHSVKQAMHPVNIAIIDDGFDLTHSELANVNVIFQYDTEENTRDASPKHTSDHHGTKIAGVLFGLVDGKGAEGLVPDANLIAIRQPNTWTSQTLLAFQVATLAKADIINCSWRSQWLLEPVKDVIQDLAVHGRDKKGVAVVFAAGNDGVEIQENQYEASISEAIVVGAYSRPGQRARYSNWGKTVDVFFDGSALLTTANRQNHTNLNGTSLAAARTTGFIAQLLFLESELTLVDIGSRLQKRRSIREE